MATRKTKPRRRTFHVSIHENVGLCAHTGPPSGYRWKSLEASRLTARIKADLKKL